LNKGCSDSAAESAAPSIKSTAMIVSCLGSIFVFPLVAQSRSPPSIVNQYSLHEKSGDRVTRLE
jgi:hypothetical protein